MVCLNFWAFRVSQNIDLRPQKTGSQVDGQRPNPETQILNPKPKSHFDLFYTCKHMTIGYICAYFFMLNTTVWFVLQEFKVSHHL